MSEPIAKNGGFFPRREFCSRYYPCKFDKAAYFERTRRNHHWVGGEKGQKALHDMRVAVAGLGGMGSGVAELLVRLGVGHIKIADPDTIDASNLNRQVIANRSTVGKKKVDASTAELRALAEDFELLCYGDGVTAENAAEFVSDTDLIIDEIDVFPLRAHIHLHEAARALGLPVYSGYIIGMGFHVYKFHGTGYTFEDFLLHSSGQIEKPSPDFLVDRYINPPPSYLREPRRRQDFVAAMREGVPIFGASCSAAQSLVVIRAVCDYLRLAEKLNTPPTPVMPEFIKFDPLDLSTRICSLTNESRKAA
jgi:molybdopterin/thiamine biosynthesis adenylyltransferase